MASLFSKPTLQAGRDEVYVATMPLRATKGPPQLLMSAAYSLNLWDLQHFMVIIKPSSPTLSQVLFHLLSTWVLHIFFNFGFLLMGFTSFLTLDFDFLIGTYEILRFSSQPLTGVLIVFIWMSFFCSILMHIFIFV